jgi:hypothetical protein
MYIYIYIYTHNRYRTLNNYRYAKPPPFSTQHPLCGSRTSGAGNGAFEEGLGKAPGSMVPRSPFSMVPHVEWWLWAYTYAVNLPFADHCYHPFIAVLEIIY